MSTQGKRRTILVVDDDACVKVSFQTCLELENYAVSVAKSSHEAIKWLEEGNAPDLIISDYLMPQGNGDILVEYAKKKSLPIIVLSGLQSEAREAIVARGIDPKDVMILAKPIEDLDAFLGWIKKKIDPLQDGEFQVAS